METLNENIRSACFDLSVSLMWEKDALTTDKIESSIVSFPKNWANQK